MKNKPFIFLSVILFGIIVSYVVFSWSEPTGNMPTNYKPPLNTSADAQDVDPNKPVIGNLNVEKLGGYTASDLLGLIGGPASYEVVEGTTCPEGAILISKYYEQKTCTYSHADCTYENNCCRNLIVHRTFSSAASGWGSSSSDTQTKRHVADMSCSPSGACDQGCVGTRVGNGWVETCESDLTHVLCLTVDAPQ